MDLSYSPEYEAFRDEVRAFAKEYRRARAARPMAATCASGRSC